MPPSMGYSGTPHGVLDTPWGTLGHIFIFSRNILFFHRVYNTNQAGPKHNKIVQHGNQSAEHGHECKHKRAASWQNQQNGMCAQRSLRSAWASAQSDQSLRCPHEESLGPYLPIECTAKTLIRLGGCPGWSESSLGAHAILLVLSRGGSNDIDSGMSTN